MTALLNSTPLKKWQCLSVMTRAAGRRPYSHITMNVRSALESCCQICYIKDRKREPIEAATLNNN